MEATLDNIVSAIVAVKLERCIDHTELMKAVEKKLIERALTGCDGIIEAVAFMQMDRKVFFRKRKEYGFEIKKGEE